ncbi:MAG: GNAT family N-acetyltransferase [Erysipelotrichaceae bacterium]|uniref:GNAT family N-acetyltransferase n=1 Tax=Floccifex sp. TaxID=2815810 RepID=UPI0029FF2FFC|nr:GNAT family N-acetyltransferase [Floccifex sp.]MDD7280718.1 GNAT family N-acetyltransferase [Erysipelotrichaceae bacterium]MDY2959148.1 GNAT family N-acetyltransferase [Floccifex sp.]
MITYRDAIIQDAQSFLTFLEQIGSESDNLTFGQEGLGITVEQEQDYIQSIIDSNSVMLLALDGNEIIGNININVLTRNRLKHRAELSITVKKAYWNQGIGTELMKQALSQSKNKNLEVISLEVRSDNKSAIHLYEKYGFTKIRTFPKFLKIDNEYIDCDLMNLYL